MKEFIVAFIYFSDGGARTSDMWTIGLLLISATRENSSLISSDGWVRVDSGFQDGLEVAFVVIVMEIYFS